MTADDEGHQANISKHELRVSILGPPCSGKTTQASRLGREFGICHLSAAGVLESHVARRTPDGKDTKEIIAYGGHVPESMMARMINNELDSNAACRNGFVLDGFPSTLGEVKHLEEILETRKQRLDHVIELDTDNELPETRIAGRLVHLASGRTYNGVHCLPRDSMKDDVTGEPLIRRSDDTSKAARARLAAYRTHIMPVAEHFKRRGIWRQVDGHRKPDSVWQDIKAGLNHWVPN
ncbi:adenylate kinase [Aspergillus unguis]